ncbi:carbohydrate sulfotransferase 1-like [Rhipicephalus sanguineus]|uniref:carbohydrate sulfotransferase 1-like n=1 Tax=Rhipicephalus sanguineus TaxID=34632 RepID=UPI001895723C|nr:carbohydrate sulfotransferase 1-like [Rhipicephalus sanguineus]
MVCHKRLLLLLSLGAALFLVVVQLAPDLGLPAVRAPPVSSVNSLLAKVSTSDTLREHHDVEGTMSPGGMVRKAMEQNNPAFLQASIAKISTTKKALSRITPAGVLRPGVVTSTSISVVRAPVAFRHFVIHQKASVTRPAMNRFKPLRLSRMLKVFNRNLDHYPVVPTDKAHRVLVVTYFRAGSTFVGDLLSATPATFYHFEPLHMFSNDARLNGSAASNASGLIGHLLRCNFQRVQHYVRWAYERKFLFKRNHFLWALCGGQYPVCFKPDFVSKVCARAPAQVMKVTRLHMSQVRDWLQSNPDLAKTMKVLHLVRDPRGILASRRLLEWCNESKSCAHQDTLCSELRADLDTFEDLQRMFPNSTYRVRYEDVSLDPKKEALKMFEALGLNYTVYVSNFLKTHTKARKADALDPYSTKRNSSTVAFQWRTKLKFDDIAEIQRSCSDVLLRLGYKTITDENDLLDEVPIAPVPHLIAAGVHTTLRVSVGTGS